MAKTRRALIPAGPTGLRPLLADRQRARSVHFLHREDTRTPQTPSSSLQRVEKSHHVPHSRSVSSSASKPDPPPATIVTHMTLDLYPVRGVSIADDLEPSVRAVQSPCGNFIWTKSEVLRAWKPQGSMRDRHRLEVVDKKLRINVIHSNVNHDGNITSKTKKLAARAGIYAYDDGPDEVTSLEHIQARLQGMQHLVSCIDIVRQEQKKMLAWGNKTKGANMMGNKDRFPEPWMKEKVANLQRIQEQKMARLEYALSVMADRTPDRELYDQLGGQQFDGQSSGQLDSELGSPTDSQVDSEFVGYFDSQLKSQVDGPATLSQSYPGQYSDFEPSSSSVASATDDSGDY